MHLRHRGGLRDPIRSVGPLTAQISAPVTNDCVRDSDTLQPSHQESSFDRKWVTIHSVYTTILDKYPDPFKGLVRTPTVAPDPGYCPQTAYLESQRNRFVRKPANFPNYWRQEGLCTLQLNPSAYSPTLKPNHPNTL